MHRCHFAQLISLSWLKTLTKLDLNQAPRTEVHIEHLEQCAEGVLRILSHSINQTDHLLSSVFGDLPLVIDVTFVAQDHPLHVC